MNTVKKILSTVLVFAVLLETTPIAFAQAPTGFGAPVDAGRATGTSFGSKGTTTLPEGVGTPTQVFQEPSYSGLMYQIHILGEINKPGTYRLPASTRLSEAIEKAGGILERGSTRSIQLRRSEGGSKAVDLLAFKQFGNLNDNPYLLDNDVIFVPLRGKVVEIEGTVRRPGIYELKGEKTIEDLFRLVGGPTPGIEGETPLKVIRFTGGVKQVIDVENTREARRAFRLENADVVVAPHFLTEKKKFDYNLATLPGDNKLFYPSYDERVNVLGGVARPGPLPFSPYYEVRQYLTLAGGTTKLAKIRKIKIINSDGKTFRASNITSINPGDTIVVPEKYMPPETFVTLVLGVTASILGIAGAIVSLKK